MERVTQQQALQIADRCVKCGLCLPGCPTYQLYGNEAESPRGRIAMIEAQLKGDLSNSATLHQHLDHCLSCGQCEKACPSQVHYLTLLQFSRSQTAKRTLADQMTEHPRLMKGAQWLARAIPKPLQSTYKGVSINNAIANSPAPKRHSYDPIGLARGRVGLLVGCTGESHQGSSLHACIKLLNAAGYQVELPQVAHCCGALAQHKGQLDKAAEQSEHCQAAFKPDIEAILTLNNGCSAHLNAIDTHLPCVDATLFVAKAVEEASIAFEALPETAALHLPCTLRNRLKQTQAVIDVLQMIPQLDLSVLDHGYGCCGAAGDQMLSHPEQASTLRQPLLDQVFHLKPDWLISSNIGCALHLMEGLNETPHRIAFAHPLEILAQQLRDNR